MEIIITEMTKGGKEYRKDIAPIIYQMLLSFNRKIKSYEVTEEYELAQVELNRKNTYIFNQSKFLKGKIKNPVDAILEIDRRTKLSPEININ